MAAPSSSAHALGRGNAMPGRGLRLIAAVHDELQQMLQEGEGWLAKGKGWDRIPSMRQDPHSYNASRLLKGSFPQQEEHGCGANIAWKETASLGTCNFF